ncbi:hypothetical protein TNIN_248891 [Trichonephila inaurata madagascariensis]|uniref:Uncharacterized protein n=1 Tax=Trichonephila inaurata madagascariensis TaxID=2747483 RepID=A0A8X6YJE2_9ARAC|nr:hypothetical protein TNIN_248891 [Trichonephila inaurata madagascariensis]
MFGTLINFTSESSSERYTQRDRVVIPFNILRYTSVGWKTIVVPYLQDLFVHKLNYHNTRLNVVHKRSRMFQSSSVCITKLIPCPYKNMVIDCKTVGLDGWSYCYARRTSAKRGSRVY